MKNLEIIDNFLDEKDYQQIYAQMLSPNFGWHVQIGMTYYADFSKQLTHLFYDNNRPNSEFFDLLNPIRSKLNCETIIREKANLTFYNDLEDDLFHIDVGKLNSKTSLFYLTDKGATTFKIDGKETTVEAKQNRMVTFDCKIEHKAVCHKVGEPFRIVINLNYFEGPIDL